MIVREDMKAATHGKVLTNLHKIKFSGSTQDISNPSTMVRGMEQAIKRSETAKLKINVFLAVLLPLFLENIDHKIPLKTSTLCYSWRFIS